MALKDLVVPSDPVVTLTGWLSFTSKRITGFTLKEPGLGAGQRACRIVLQVPKSVFMIPTFSVKVAFDPAPEPKNVAEVGAEFQRILRNADFRVEVAALEAPESTEVAEHIKEPSDAPV